MEENAEVKHLLDESKYIMIKSVELIFASVFRKRLIDDLDPETQRKSQFSPDPNFR